VPAIAGLPFFMVIGMGLEILSFTPTSDAERFHDSTNLLTDKCN